MEIDTILGIALQSQVVCESLHSGPQHSRYPS